MCPSTNRAVRNIGPNNVDTGDGKLSVMSRHFPRLILIIILFYQVKVLEQQLESEHEERINFMREKHELETKIINLQELANRSADEEQVAKLKKDLKRTKALLKDAQLMIEKSRNESSNKV